MLIQTLQELNTAALNRKAVICPNSMSYNRPRPAAFMINMSGRTLLGIMNSGMYVYDKEDKPLMAAVERRRKLQDEIKQRRKMKNGR